jgi:multimeric flavodoxin WrbA
MGAIYRIFKIFLDGAAAAGAETETIYLAKRKINYCTGCFNCWLVHPGRCIHQDDMPEILHKIKYAEVLVYASPVYVDGFTAQMKTMMDRCITGAQPFIEFQDGHSRHPGRGKGTGPRKKVVLISCCGFGELDNFDVIIHHMQAIARNMQADFLGALVRPMGPILEFMEAGAPQIVGPIYEGFRQAGREAVERGMISEDAQVQARAPLMTMEHFTNMANKFFQMEIDRHAKKKEKIPAAAPAPEG